MTSEKKRCGWCEDQADLTLFSKADKKIYGFCNESCWLSFSEISFRDLCPKCNKKAKLLSVPAVNKDDLNEQFVNYCDDCFSSNFSNSDKNKKETVNSKQHQNTQLKNEKLDNLIDNKIKLNNSIESTANQSSINNSSNNLNSSNSSMNSLKVNHNQTPNNTSSLNNSQINQSINQPKKPRQFKNQPYEIWGCFNWDNYLKLDGSTRAPANCFAQNENPPENEFELNMKLEAPDPRNSNSTCIATVVSIMGFRIELRLDGTDNTNDFWLPVDSDKIHPIGHANNTNGMLQPPLGFRKNPSNWPVFVTQTLNNAVIAPDSCFKTPPVPPVKNLFKVGQKLEAVDRKNPRLICPATISQVKDSMVFVSFDGWKGAFDYWVRFDSREIYPCGWCERSNHPLQMPGNKDLKIDTNLLTVNYPNRIPYQTTNKIPNRSNSNKVNININGNGVISNENSDSNEQISIDKKTDDKNKINNQNNNDKNNNDKNNNKLTENLPKISDKETTSTITSSKSESSLKNLLLDKEKSESVNNNNSDNRINGVNNKNVALINSNNNNNNNNVNKLNQTTITPIAKNAFLNSLSSTPINRNTSINNSTSTSSSNLNNKNIPNTNQQTPKTENNKVEVNKHPLVTVYLNIECNPGKFINLDEFKRVVKQYPESKIGPTPLNKTMRDVLQLIVDCSIDKNQVTRMIRPGNGNFAVETVINNNKIKINLPHFNRASAFWNYLNNFLGGLDCCVRLVQQSAIECKSCSNIKESQIKDKKYLLNQQFLRHQQLLNKQQQLQNKQQQTIKQLNKHHQLNKLHQQSNNNVTASNKIPIAQKNQDIKKTTLSFPASNHLIQPAPQQQQSNKNLKRKSSTEEDSDSSKINSAKIIKTATNSNNNSLNISTSISTPSAKSTTNNSTPITKTNGHISSDLDQSLSNPNDWTTDEVISFLKINDPSLDYAELFKQHEIDGKAFLLLNSDMLMKYMRIKLGPALKISSIIENLKQNQKLLN